MSYDDALVTAPTAPDGTSWDDYLVASWHHPYFSQGPGEYVTPEYEAYIAPGGPAEQFRNVYEGIAYGPLHPDVYRYQSPEAEALARQIVENATRKDTFSVFGDQFFQALAALGAAVGGAAAYGGFAAAPAGAGAGVTAGEAAGVAGEGALFASTPGTAGWQAATAGAVGTGSSAGLAPGAALSALEASPMTSLVGAAPLTGAGGGSTAAGVAGGATGSVASTSGSLLSTLKDIAPVVGPLVTAGSSIVGGILGADTAKEAAKTQATATQAALDQERAIYEQNRADLAPYRETGYRALGDLRTLAGAPLTFPDWDPSPYAYTAPVPLDPSRYAFNPQDYAFTAPTAETLPQDPGYQFRVAEGQKALERSASARGGVLNGGTLKALTRYGQDMGTQEYQNAYARTLQENELRYGRALADNERRYLRDMTQNQDIYQRSLGDNDRAYGRARDAYGLNWGTRESLRGRQWNELASLAGIGQTATTTGASLGAQFGTSLGAGLQNIGALNAAGQVGAFNNLTAGITGGVNSALNQYMQWQLLSKLGNP